MFAFALENELRGVDLMEREHRAEIYLRRVVALTGSKQMSDQCVLDIGRTRFCVREAYVERLRDVTDPSCTHEGTCFYLPHQFIPAAEKIATVLLHLKNNPALFDRWVATRAAFKADGHPYSAFTP